MLAGETRFEHATYGFGDRYSTVEPLPYKQKLLYNKKNFLSNIFRRYYEGFPDFCEKNFPPTQRKDMKKQIILYTDGACSGNPGIGGYAGILIYKDVRREYSGGELSTTNNRMEVRAVIEGLQKLKYPCAVDVYSDSAYTVNAFANRWIYGWKKNGWKKADGKAVLNVDLWERLYELTRVHEVTFHKVAGHADDDLNNRCDELARQAISSLRDSLPEQAEEGESAEVSGSETN